MPRTTGSEAWAAWPLTHGTEASVTRPFTLFTHLVHTCGASCGRLCNPPSGTSAGPQTTQRPRAQGSRNPKTIRRGATSRQHLLSCPCPQEGQKKKRRGTPASLDRILIGRISKVQTGRAVLPSKGAYLVVCEGMTAQVPSNARILHLLSKKPLFDN